MSFQKQAEDQIRFVWAVRVIALLASAFLALVVSSIWNIQYLVVLVPMGLVALGLSFTFIEIYKPLLYPKCGEKMKIRERSDTPVSYECPHCGFSHETSTTSNKWDPRDYGP